ncbi:MAG: extracellular solute-binding protein [Firmicutes bacterium]|nr:extracellular solute-binding protein [Bacillota bacterium]
MEQPPHRVKQFQATIDRFNKENPDIFVRQQVIDWMEAYTKAMAAIQSGNQPELLFTIPDFTTVIKQSGAVQPVDDIIQELNKKYHFIQATLDPYHYDGHYWAVPTYGMVHMLWYRKDLFKKAGLDPNSPPKTWNDLKAAAAKLTKGKIYGIGLPASKHMYTDQAIYSFMITNKAEHIFGPDGKVIFDNPRTVETFEFYKELSAYSPPDSTSWSWAEPQLAFNNGTLAMAIEKGQFLGPFEKESGVSWENLGGAPVPWPADGQRGSIFYSNGVMLLTKNKAKVEAVKRFLSYLFEPEVNGEWLTGMEPGLFLPVTEATSDSKAFWKNAIVAKYPKLVKLMIEQSSYGRLFGFTRDKVDPNIGKISGQNILAQVVQKVIVEKMSPDKAVKWGADQMRAAVGQ